MSDCSVGKIEVQVGKSGSQVGIFGLQVGKIERQVGKSGSQVGIFGLQVGKIELQVGKEKIWNLKPINFHMKIR
ncbi:hypothetical protein [Paenisporosarcina sp. TG20]|uniref:hypothetical protein n=1 Tax=Paenisporosarcina sp. TG20 TaxID=1211706 RepID=UPI0002EB53F9|nr:hypothetical protein [Paenisporosarcina sp. TG20]